MKSHIGIVAALVLGAPALVAAQSDSAFSVPIEVKSQGVTLRATMHVAAGAGPHATLVSLKGFPGNNSEAFPAFLQSRGFNAIAMNFRGQLPSDGNYDVGGTPADAAAIIAFLRSDSARRTFRIDPRRIAISGTSAGSFGALSSAAADQSIGCVALVVPFNWTVTLLQSRENPLGRSMMIQQAQSLARRNPPTVRLDTAFVTRILANAEAYDLRPVANRLSGRNVLMIGAQHDSTARLSGHFIPVRDSLKKAQAAVRDTILDDTHNLSRSGDLVYNLVASWLRDCTR